jgi:hypothetical protein
MQSTTQGGLIVKEDWEKPKLVVLYRGRPEESVLTACKIANKVAGPTNPGAGRMNCQPWKVAPTTCQSACIDYSAS